MRFTEDLKALEPAAVAMGCFGVCAALVAGRIIYLLIFN